MNAPDRVRNLPSSANRPEDLVGFDMIRRLVAFPTVSRDSNLELIEWVRGYLEDLGATTALTFDDERRKANLFATLPAQDGNATRGGIVLSGHTDVVPVDGQPWDTNPFEATRHRAPAARSRRHRHEELLGDRPRVRAGVPAPRPQRGRCISRCPTTRRSAASACAG